MGQSIRERIEEVFAMRTIDPSESHAIVEQIMEIVDDAISGAYTEGVHVGQESCH